MGWKSLTALCIVSTEEQVYKDFHLLRFHGALLALFEVPFNHQDAFIWSLDPVLTFAFPSLHSAHKVPENKLKTIIKLLESY